MSSGVGGEGAGRLAERMGHAPGGSDCFSLSAFSASVTQSVYRYLLHRTLNLVTVFDFLIFTDCASFRRAVRRKSLISLICFGCEQNTRTLASRYAYAGHTPTRKTSSLDPDASRPRPATRAPVPSGCV